MSRFMVLAKCTLKGRVDIGATKESYAELSNLFKTKGARILNAYAIMGHYDYCFITDVPELHDTFEISAMIGTLGFLECETYPLLALEDLFKVF